MKRGFTLVEMLIVVGIIAVLIGASMAGFSKMMKSAERARAQELVSNAVTALNALYDADGFWPKIMRTSGATEGKMDEDVAKVLSERGYMSLSMSGRDRLGVVTPWAAKIIERKGLSATLSTPVNGSSTIEDHLLRYAVDLDGDGLIKGAVVGGETIDIRATAAVWCCGKDGKLESYTKGLKSDDVYSWTKGQTQSIE